jgi:DNA-binding CsgD family transcriptional regulator
VRTSREDLPEYVLDAFIARLYRSGLSVAPEGYRNWSLQQLRRVIAFDGALWGSGTRKDMHFHTVELVGLPREFADILESTYRINPIVPHILNKLETPVDMEEVSPDKEFFKSEVYKTCFERFGVSRILSTAHVDERSGLYSLLTLYRKDRAARFREEEKALHKRATFHLFEAASHAFFLHLTRAHTERPPGSAAAVVDTLGQYYEAQPRFLDLIEKHFPQHGAETLPFAAPAVGKVAYIGELCAKTEAFGDLVCVYLWTAGPLDRLTVREREIVYAVTQGLSFKQAARKIGVAPSTVANHLYRIYRKLGLNNRSELAGLVYPATGN